jgi:hypothetical protein
MRKRLFLGTALPLLMALMVGCTTSSTSTTEAANTSATAMSAVDTTATAATASTPVEDTVVGGTEAATTTATSKSTAESGWTSEPVGEYSQFQGRVETVAFAPDGRGVAFTSIDTSCCSTATFGWARSADATWKPIPNPKETFVAGKVNGALGGPTKVVWFKDRFIAAGTRGGGAPTDSATEINSGTPAIPTIWTSPDGLVWTATETPGNSTPLDLLIALDGQTVLGLWTAGENLDIRSTVDGITWKPLSTITTLQAGRSLYVAKLTSVVSADDKPIRYAVTGAMSALATSTTGNTASFVSTTSDGVTWNTQELPNPPHLPNAYPTHAVAFNGQVIVYGTAYYEIVGSSVNTAVGWASSDGGTTFNPLELSTKCNGSFTSMIVDKAAPEPTLFAVCTALDGTPEGDFIPSLDRLVLTHDGATFETPNAMSPEWSTPSVDSKLGPVTIDGSGRVVMPVIKPNGDAGRIVTLWRS